MKHIGLGFDRLFREPILLIGQRTTNLNGFSLNSSLFRTDDMTTQGIYILNFFPYYAGL